MCARPGSQVLAPAVSVKVDVGSGFQNRGYRTVGGFEKLNNLRFCLKKSVAADLLSVMPCGDREIKPFSWSKSQLAEERSLFWRTPLTALVEEACVRSHVELAGGKGFGPSNHVLPSLVREKMRFRQN